MVMNKKEINLIAAAILRNAKKRGLIIAMNIVPLYDHKGRKL